MKEQRRRRDFTHLKPLPYNLSMTNIDLLLPFGLPTPELAPDLIKAIKAPSLAHLLSRGNTKPALEFEPFARALPHEVWLAKQSNLPMQGSPALSTVAMQSFGLQANQADWFFIQPAHFHIARDHLVLTDMRQLHVTEQEGRTLFDVAKPLFDEVGNALLYGDAYTWFVQNHDWRDLLTTTPDAACGHNIDIWMPKGSKERDWRKLHNEVQMHWHEHPINSAREQRGLRPVNSLWLWGGSPHSENIPSCCYTEVFYLSNTTPSLSLPCARKTKVKDINTVIDSPTQHGLLVLDALIEPALAGDWAEWLDRLHTLESNWFLPLLNTVKSRTIGQLRCILTHNTALSEFTVTPNTLRKFWIKPTLNKLAT